MSTGDVSTLVLRAGLFSAAELGATVLDPDPDPIDLLNGTFKLEDVGGIPNYFPAQPGLKNGGVWDDPANRDGRELAFSANTNVTEVITLVATNGDLQGRHAALKKFNLFAHWARKYNEDMTTDPRAISLEYAIEGGKGSQYAQVFNIEVSAEADEADGFGLPMLSRITLTIERSGGWQGIPIGASPRVWTLEALRGKFPTNSGSPSGTQYNYTHLSLVEISPAAGYENAAEKQVYNVCEYGAGAVGSLRDNFIDIPPSVIGGDSDCPMALTVIANAGEAGATLDFRRLHVALKSNPQNNPGSPAIHIRNTYNGGDASTLSTTGVTMTKVNVASSQSQGIRSDGSNTNRYYLRFSIGSGAVSGQAANAQWVLDEYSMRGAYNVYFRGGTDAGGAPNQMRLSFSYTPRQVAPSREIGVITPPELLAAGEPQLVFVGTLVIDPYQSSPDGKGVTADAFFGRLNVKGYRSAGSTVTTIRLWDVILMPYDEGAAILHCNFENNTPPAIGVVMDSSEYISRFNGGSMAQIADSGFQIYTLPLSDISGRPIKLKPGRTNRLYFLGEANGQSSTLQAASSMTFRVIAHPVPHWFGIRDV